MADGVYKVGRTFQEYGPHLKRLGAYPGDSEIVYVRKCDPELVATETTIVRAFRNNFGSHLRGSEYFIGPENVMIDLIHKELSPSPQKQPEPTKKVNVPIESDHVRFFRERLKTIETETFTFLAHKMYEEYEKWSEFKPETDRVSFGLWISKLGQGVFRKVVGGGKKLYTIHRDTVLNNLSPTPLPSP